MARGGGLDGKTSETPSARPARHTAARSYNIIRHADGSTRRALVSCHATICESVIIFIDLDDETSSSKLYHHVVVRASARAHTLAHTHARAHARTHAHVHTRTHDSAPSETDLLFSRLIDACIRHTWHGYTALVPTRVGFYRLVTRALRGPTDGSLFFFISSRNTYVYTRSFHFCTRGNVHIGNNATFLFARSGRLRNASGVRVSAVRAGGYPLQDRRTTIHDVW